MLSKRTKRGKVRRLHDIMDASRFANRLLGISIPIMMTRLTRSTTNRCEAYCHVFCQETGISWR